MATLYVSQTATNGYRVGVDSGAGTTKATAWLTLDYAITNCSNNDTIVINDGTYTHASIYWAPTNSGLTINAENRHLAILKQAGSQARVFHITDAATGITFGEVVLDAENDAANIVTQGTAGSSITFSGTKLLNPTASFINFNRDINITFSNNFVCSATSLTTDAFKIASTAANGAAAGAISLSNGTIDITTFTAGRDVLNIVPSDVAAKTFSISGVTITAANGANSLDALRVLGCSSVSILNNTINLTSTAATRSIIVENSALDVCDSCHVGGNTCTHSQSTLGTGIQVGADADADANANSITTPYVYDNVVSNGNHGILIGWVTGGRAYGNKISNNVLGLVFKGTIDSRSSGNLIIDNTGGGALRFKGDTDGVHANNVVSYTNGASVSGATAIYADAAGATNSTGCGVYNNVIYANETILDWTNIAAASTCTFNSNNYYATASGGVSADPYNYQGTGYANLAAWNAAATVTGETETDPDFTNLANGDYTTQVAALSTGGYVWWGTEARPEGYDGEPFSDRNASVGGVQGKDSTNHPYHPVNL